MIEVYSSRCLCINVEVCTLL